MHEITEENSTVRLCDSCWDGMFLNSRSAMVQIMKCEGCGKEGITNVLPPGGKVVYLNDDGTPMVTYVEREGV